MKNVTRPRQFAHLSAGFSLVEMIGVLAIIAILAVVIVPKVFATIASSRVTNAVGSITSLRTALSDFSGKYGTLPVLGGTNVSATNARIDDLLIKAQLMDSRFMPKIGTQSATTVAGAPWAQNATTGAWQAPTGGSAQTGFSRVITVTSDVAAPATGNNYRFDGATNLIPANSIIASAVIKGVTANDARDLSLRIDGDALSQTNTTTADIRGKVVYAIPANGVTDVYIYLVHQ